MIDPRRPDFGRPPAHADRPHFGYAPRADDEPAISIVTPFHTGGRHFESTLRSVLGQSLQQWEWWIVNDAASEPDSLAALAAARDLDPRIRVVDRASNGGPGAARNQGAASARAGVLFFLDDDDLLEPTALEKSLWFLESHPELDFAASWSVGFGADEYLWSRGPHDGAAMLDDNLTTSHFAIRRGAFEAVGGFDDSLRDGLEDWEFWIRCASRGRWGSTIPEYLSWYRRRAHHADRWTNYEPSRIEAFREGLRRRFTDLYRDGFEPTGARPPAAFDPVPDELPWRNELARDCRRLLMIVPWLTLGGSDRFNLDVVEQLSRRGWEITLATTLEGDCSWAPAFARHTPDVFVLDHFLRLPDRPRFLRYLIGSRRPDVVLVSNSELGYLLLPYLRAHRPEPAYVDYCHMEQEDWKSGGYPRLSLTERDSLDAQIVSSGHLAGWMAERGADRERIRVVHTGIDTDRWRRDPSARRNLRERWRVSEDTPVALFAGRLCDQKRPPVLARTALALARRGVDFRLVVAGDGEDRPWLERFVERHDLSLHVRLLGALSSDETRDAMSASDLLFLPSRWEGIALSLYEAMAMELAVVAADVGGQRELVTPECGVLIAPGSEDDEVGRYTEVLEALLADAGLRARLGATARERVVAGFPLHGMVDGLLEAFERARSAQPRAPALPVELAAAWATQVIEYARLGAAAEALWAEREIPRTGPVATPLDTRLEALSVEAQLATIEGSRSWRVVNRLARSAVGEPGAGEDPRLRLARIKASPAFRLIRAFKRLPGYGLYSRYRWGPHELKPWNSP